MRDFKFFTDVEKKEESLLLSNVTYFQYTKDDCVHQFIINDYSITTDSSGWPILSHELSINCDLTTERRNEILEHFRLSKNVGNITMTLNDQIISKIHFNFVMKVIYWSVGDDNCDITFGLDFYRNS